MNETKPEAEFPKPELPGTSGPEAEAAAALRSIARDEKIKAYVQTERPVHDAFLGAALRFIGGERLEECLDVAKRVNEAGHAVTIDYMGESTGDEEMATAATKEFLRVTRQISERGLDASISLDLSHVGLIVDQDLAFENAAALAAETQSLGLEMMISMEGSERTSEVLGMYHKLSERFPNVGITLQAYLHRTPVDFRDVLGRPGKIRLVKGAFEEAEDVAMTRGRNLDGAYRSFMKELLSIGHPASIATHDPALLEHAHHFMKDGKSAIQTTEFEMLYGVQTDRLDQMRALGYGTRVYLPYGVEWYLYVCHRLAEHPPNIYRAVGDAVARFHKK